MTQQKEWGSGAGAAWLPGRGPHDCLWNTELIACLSDCWSSPLKKGLARLTCLCLRPQDRRELSGLIWIGCNEGQAQEPGNSSDF